jgi:hypothetical protein
MPFSCLHSHPPTTAIPAAMHIHSHALPPGIPIDVDCTRTLKPITQTYYYCGQTSHISRECDVCHDIHHMTLDEQNEFIQQIMANCNAAVAAAAELTTHTGTYKGMLVEREVDGTDFVRSSR